MTKNTSQRLLIFFGGIPLFVVCVIFASFGRNFLLLLLVLVVQVLAVGETSALFKAKGVVLDSRLLTVLAAINSLFVYCSPWLKKYIPSSVSPLEILCMASTLGCLIVAAPFAFAKQGDFGTILERLGASLFVFFYCGILGAFIVYITSCFGQYQAPVFTFTLMVFGNDSLAWLVGVTLGKRRGIVPVSPNKSLAGFIGGLSGSIIAGVLAFFLFPTSNFKSPLESVLFGLVVGCAVIIGDLVESALKRSAGVKDSSARVPGRGGVLDSFDSLLFSAPVFVIISLSMGFFPPLA